MTFHLSAGNRHDAPKGRKLIESIFSDNEHYLLREYDKELYKRRNEVERYFLRLKLFRKVFTRYDKLDVIYFSIVSLAMIFDAILM